MPTTNNQDNSSSAAQGGATRGPGSADAVGQQCVSAVVHLAGGIDIETGHLAHYSISHSLARIAGVLIYFLDPAAVTAFAATVAAPLGTPPTCSDTPNPIRLPAKRFTTAHEVPHILRLLTRIQRRGKQRLRAVPADQEPLMPSGFVLCR